MKPLPFPVLSATAAGLLLWLPPASLHAQRRDVGTGTNPAATRATQTTPDGQSAADLREPDSLDGIGVPATAEAERVVVTGSLDEKRNDIAPNLGATSYGISQNQIANQSQGSDASFNQTLLRVPGFAQDSYGQLHVRGEHANLQFRINDVLLPEGIAGFGQELDTRFVDSLQVVTGSLPAQYGLRTAGVIDIHTKSGAFNNGDELGLYAGSYNTYRPSLELAGAAGKLSYFFTGDFLTSGVGIESPDGKSYPIHDHTEQYRGFGYLQYLVDSTSRLSLIVSAYDADFQIPNNPGQPPAFALAGTPILAGSITPPQSTGGGTGFGSTGMPTPTGVAQPFGISNFGSNRLNENQNEQNYYAVLAYQKSSDKLDFQASTFIRESSVLFRPDDRGDLIFTGVASRVDRFTLTGGSELDASYRLTDAHTLRGGGVLLVQHEENHAATNVFPVDDTGAQSSDVPQRLAFQQRKTGTIYGVYLQDEWRILAPLTLNFGLRYDRVDEFTHEGQLSPRVNLVYQPFKETVLHAGYSRYFTPPVFETIQTGNVARTLGTTAAPATTQNSTSKSERANYFDAGATQNLFGCLQLGIDGYYKRAVQQIDEGQFGAAIIQTDFNYRFGEVYGLEGTLTFTKGGFEAYANAAYSSALGRRITSAQFLFGPDELAYIDKSYIHLDHDQTATISAGASYSYKPQAARVYADMLYGSGLRAGFANTDKVPAYYTFNLGVEKGFRIPHLGQAKVRFDVVNLLDRVYQLRNGSGVGVGAPQFGQRRGLYGGLSIDFGPQPEAKATLPAPKGGK